MDETMPCINNSCHILGTFLSLEICHGRRRYGLKLFRLSTSEILIVVIYRYMFMYTYKYICLYINIYIYVCIFMFFFTCILICN